MVAANDPRVELCGFARLLGDSVDYIVRKYEVILGRASKSGTTDVVLGENMNISRQHAKVTWSPSSKSFVLVVMGKNGVSVNGTLYTPSSAPLELKSKDALMVGDKLFYFLLPKQPADIGKPDLEQLAASAATVKRPRPNAAAPQLAPAPAVAAHSQVNPLIANIGLGAPPASLRQYGVALQQPHHAALNHQQQLQLQQMQLAAQQQAAQQQQQLLMAQQHPLQQQAAMAVLQQGGAVVQPMAAHVITTGLGGTGPAGMVPVSNGSVPVAGMQLQPPPPQ